MTYKNPNLIGNLEPLQKSVASIESMMSKLDQIISSSPHRNYSRYIHAPRSKHIKTLLEQIAPSLLKDAFSNTIGNTGRLSTYGLPRPNQGQMLADMAAAMSRASTRYL